MLKLAKYLKDYKLQLVIGPSFKLLEAILELIIPLIMADIIDIGVKNNDKHYILTRGGIILLLGTIGLCSALICQYSASIASQGIGTKLRTALYKHINSLSSKEINKIGTASLITRLTTDINAIQLVVALLIRLATRTVFLVTGSLVMAVIVDVKLSVIFFISAPIIALILYYISKKSIPLFKKVQRKLDKISLISRENLGGARVVRAFSKQDYEKANLSEASDDLTRTYIKFGKISILLNPLTYAVTNISIAFIIWFGAIEVNVGRLSQGSIIALSNYMTQITLTMVVIANTIAILTRASVSAERINEVFDLTSSIEYGDKSIDANNNCAVQFDNVSFGYSDNKMILEDVSFVLNKGKSLGIIGATGSGKTTIINLINRLYDTQKGNIKIFGTDIREISHNSLCQNISLTSQKAPLLSGTIRKNIDLNGKCDDSMIWNALKIANADGFVNELSDKLDHIVLQGGKNFSGGQKQRLCIARTIANNGEILIFDDSFSALDNKTQSDIKQSLNSLTDKTKIIVSQRVNSIYDCDKILVMSNGKVIASGSHNELLDTCDEYLEICKSQDFAEVRA